MKNALLHGSGLRDAFDFVQAFARGHGLESSITYRLSLLFKFNSLMSRKRTAENFKPAREKYSSASNGMMMDFPSGVS